MSDIVFILDKMELILQAVSKIGKDGKYSTVPVSYTHLSDIHYTPYKQVKGEANPFDPEYDDYFSQRKEQQMLESLKGRKSLLYLSLIHI